MKKSLVALLLSSANIVLAQSSNPLVASSKAIYGIVSGNVVKAAEEMPEENYSFKPTPEVRSFGQLIGHVADAQYAFCGAASGEKANPPNAEKTKTSKADLVQALKDAVAYCDKAYSGLTDAEAVQTVKFFGRELPKLSVLSFNTAHTDEHYGNIVTYLRLKGLVPPSSQR